MLREARPVPSLRPGFREQVWRRIERSATSDQPVGRMPWLDAVAALVLRPRFALAAVALLMLAGVLFGARDGRQIARREAQARYLAAVAPNSLR